MKIQSKCSQCGKESFHYRYKKQKNFFCNSFCYGKWQKGRKLSLERIEILIRSRKHGKNNVICDYCKIEFHKPPSAISQKNFCCLDHKVRPRIKAIINKSCLYCGITFQPKTKKRKYCSNKCSGLNNRKPNIIKNGYKKILIPEHPRSDVKGYVLEHIVILEKKLNRNLKPGEASHHIDKNKLNNNPDNLTVFENHSIHIKSAHSSK